MIWLVFSICFVLLVGMFLGGLCAGAAKQPTMEDQP
jgi:hypothetical protein